MKDAACATCGTVLPAASVLYDEHGDVRCQRCLMAAQTAAAQKTVAMRLKGVAYGCPVIALIALFYNPGFILTFAAIANGVYVLRNVKEPATAKHLEGSIQKVKAVVIVGMVLGVICGLVHLRFFPAGGE